MDEPWLLSRETMTPVERAILGLAALVPLWGFWDLVVRPWPAALSLFGLLILPIAIGALAIGTLLFLAAILAPEREVRVDPLGRRVLDQGMTRWFGPWWRVHPFDAIEAVAVDRDAEGAERWRLLLRLRGRKEPVVLATRPTPAALDLLAHRLRAALQS